MISNEYLSQLQKIFQDKSRPNGFGGKVKKLGKFCEYVDKWQPRSLLDYGCGKGIILEHLQKNYPNVTIDGYDPAVPLYANIPNKKYDCVFSNDVLEHIEPFYIDNVLQHIDTLSTNFIWMRIDTWPARKTLTDGRNAHILLKSDDWWLDKIKSIVSGNIIYKTLSKGKFDIAIEK